MNRILSVLAGIALLIATSGVSAQVFASIEKSEPVSFIDSSVAPTAAYEEFLNSNYPDLDLSVKDHSSPQAYKQMEILENYLNPSIDFLRASGGHSLTLPDRSLLQLSCSKTICGNGGGPCRTCLVDKQWRK